MHLSSLKHRIQKIYITNSHNVKGYKSYYYYFKFMNKPFLVGQIILQAVIQECLRITLLGKCMQVQAHTHTHTQFAPLSLFWATSLAMGVFSFLVPWHPHTFSPSCFPSLAQTASDSLMRRNPAGTQSFSLLCVNKKRRLCAIAMISSWKKRGKGKVISLAAELMVNIITLSSSALAMLVL